MKTRIKLLCLLLLGHALGAQTTSKPLTTEVLRTYTDYFTIDDTSFKGTGADVLKDLIRKSQFIVYGEMHNSQQTAIINEALMPVLASSGYKHFAVEVGPHSAEKLSQLSTPARVTVAQLKAFNAAYSVTEGEDTAVPIPFFENVSDAKFLKAARANGMQLWGLDQEYYYAAFFLMDEMANTVKDQADYNSICTKRDIAKGAMFKHFMAEAKGDIDDPFGPILNEAAVKAYFKAFAKDNTKAQAIIKDLTISWHIYINWRNDSHADRISYMRNNFMTNYNRALKTEKAPKVFTKIGGLHAKKIVSNGAYDIGELVTELAKKNKTIATSIISWRPYEIGADGQITNLFETYKNNYRRYAVFIPLAKTNAWAIINLRRLREALEANSLALPTDGSYHKLRQLIYGYDFLLMLPADAAVVPNR